MISNKDFETFLFLMISFVFLSVNPMRLKASINASSDMTDRENKIRGDIENLIRLPGVWIDLLNNLHLKKLEEIMGK